MLQSIIRPKLYATLACSYVDGCLLGCRPDTRDVQFVHLVDQQISEVGRLLWELSGEFLQILIAGQINDAKVKIHGRVVLRDIALW